MGEKVRTGGDSGEPPEIALSLSTGSRSLHYSYRCIFSFLLLIVRRAAAAVNSTNLELLTETEELYKVTHYRCSISFCSNIYKVIFLF